jgi:hypothetical protein
VFCFSFHLPVASADFRLEGNVLVFLKNKGAKDCGADSEYDRDTLKLGDFGSMTSISSAMRPGTELRFRCPHMHEVS